MKMISFNENAVKSNIVNISLQDKIEKLQFDKNAKLSTIARRIIEKYWNEDDK